MSEFQPGRYIVKHTLHKNISVLSTEGDDNIIARYQRNQAGETWCIERFGKDAYVISNYDNDQQYASYSPTAPEVGGHIRVKMRGEEAPSRWKIIRCDKIKKEYWISSVDPPLYWSLDRPNTNHPITLVRNYRSNDCRWELIQVNDPANRQDDDNIYSKINICVSRMSREERVTPLSNNLTPSKLVTHPGLLWPTGKTILIRFLDEDVELPVKKKIENYAQKWTAHANINFKFVDDANLNTHIRISFVKNGSTHSVVGTQALAVPQDQSTMNFAHLSSDSREEEFSSYVLHEFGHALGLHHEHQSPEADIPWNIDAVHAFFGGELRWSEEEINLNVLWRYNRNTTQFTDFDTRSIMMYAIDKRLTVNEEYEVDWNTQLSESDKAYIRQLYPGRKDDSPRHTLSFDDRQIFYRVVPTGRYKIANAKHSTRIKFDRHSRVTRIYSWPNDIEGDCWDVVRLPNDKYTIRNATEMEYSVSYLPGSKVDADVLLQLGEATEWKISMSNKRGEYWISPVGEDIYWDLDSDQPNDLVKFSTNHVAESTKWKLHMASE